MFPVESTFKTYTGLDGQPLDNGYVYFGQPNQDPIAHPVTVYWDASGTLPAAQPLRTVNGYIMNAGTPANVYFDGVYSELVKDSKARQVFYAQTSDDFSIASAVRNFVASLATSSGSAQIGFVQAGPGAVARSVQGKLREVISVVDRGAVGDGATNNDAAFTAMEGASDTEYFVPAGLYITSKPYLYKQYHGPGTIQLAGGLHRDGRSAADLRAKYADSIYLPNANPSAVAGQRGVIFVGDSITYGYNVAEAESYPYLVAQTINNLAPTANTTKVIGGIFDRAIIAGATAFGSKGPVKQSLIMQTGATVTFGAGNFDYVGFWYQRAVGAGSIAMTVDGVNVGTINCAGAAANDLLGLSSFYRATLGTVVLTCSGGPVELTGLYTSRTLQDGQLYIGAQAIGGYATSDFIGAATLASIGAQATTFGSQYPTLVIALGTNDIYNASKAVSSAIYKANLITIAAALRAYGIPVLTVPLRANQSTYAPVLEPFENYRNAAYEVARRYGYKVIDLSERDIDSSGGYQADGLHPNSFGHRQLAAVYMSELGLAGAAYVLPDSTLAMAGAYAALGGTYAAPWCEMASNGIVSLAGVVVTNGSAKGTPITTLPMPFRPTRQRLFVVSGLNGAAGATATITISTAGVVTLFDYSSAALTHVSLDGISYSTKR